MKLIIIQGTTSTGKTTLALKLSRDLKLQRFLKDEYKEEQFDLLGKTPSLWLGYKIEQASWRELCKAVATSRSDLIIEGNFTKRRKRQLQKVLSPDTEIVEIFCYSKGFVPLKRYIKRGEGDERHPGHRSRYSYPFVLLEMICANIGLDWIRSLQLSPYLLKVDTTDFAKMDYKQIKEFVQDS